MLMESPAQLVPSDMTGTWCVAMLLARHEQRVVRELGILGDIGTYLPMVRVKQYDGNQNRYVTRPLFPGFLFACLSAAANPSDLRRMYSVRGVIEVRNQARLVKDLDRIHLSVQRGEIQPYRLPVVGETCRVTNGPYVDMKGKLIRAGGSAPRFVIQPFEGACAELHVRPDWLEVIEPRREIA